MSNEFHTLEESLKNFFAEICNDSRNARSMNVYKYNNLKIYIDPKKSNIPHFIVRIGISEALYDLVKGEKISGGLGSDEQIVRKWIHKNLGRMNLGFMWNDYKKVKTIMGKEED